MIAAEETTLALPQGADVRLISAQNPMEPLVRVYRDYPGNFLVPKHLKTGLYAGAWWTENWPRLQAHMRSRPMRVLRRLEISLRPRSVAAGALPEMLQTELGRDMAMCGELNVKSLDPTVVKIHLRGPS